MSQTVHATSVSLPDQMAALSPMILSDRLITLAQDADRVGQTAVARTLLGLAFTVFDEAVGQA